MIQTSGGIAEKFSVKPRREEQLFLIEFFWGVGGGYGSQKLEKLCTKCVEL